MRLTEATSTSRQLMKRAKHLAPGSSSGRAPTGTHLAKDPVPDSVTKVLTVDIGLDGSGSDHTDEWRSTQSLPSHVDDVGLVPAFTVGDVHAAHLPDRYCNMSCPTIILSFSPCCNWSSIAFDLTHMQEAAVAYLSFKRLMQKWLPLLSACCCQ